MRIIAGTHRRRVIRPPADLPVRPTTDMAKEGLFNIFRNLIEFEGKSALDLFSGTGSIAFELVSRGCKQVVAVDQNKNCVEWIRKGTGQFDMHNLQVKHFDSFKYIVQNPLRFDIIFADPPYNMDRVEGLSVLIFKYQILEPGGWLVIEHSANVDLSMQSHFDNHRKYGKVNFSFFHLETEN